MPAATTGPFGHLAAFLNDLSSRLSTQGSSLSSFDVCGQKGETIDALTERVEDRGSRLSYLAQQAHDASRSASQQSGYDDELTRAPLIGEVEQAEATAKAERAKMLSMRNNPQPYQRAMAEAKRVRDEYDSAHEQHRNSTEGTSFPEPNSDSDSGATRVRPLSPSGGDGGGHDAKSMGNLHENGDGGGSGSGGGGSMGGGMGGLGGSPSDAAGKASDAAGQAPQGMPGGQPQMGGGAPEAPQMPPMMPGDVPGGADRGSGADLPPFIPDDAVGTSTSSDTSAPSMGSSVTGVRTPSDISGVSPSTTGSGAAPGQGGQGGMARGGGMMGGMGGMGGGMGGNQSQKKEKPVIYSSDRDLLGDSSVENAVRGGVIGRDSAKPPEQEQQPPRT